MNHEIYFLNIVKLVKPRIGEKPVEFNVHIADDLPHILYGDGTKSKTGCY